MASINDILKNLERYQDVTQTILTNHQMMAEMLLMRVEKLESAVDKITSLLIANRQSANEPHHEH